MCSSLPIREMLVEKMMGILTHFRRENMPAGPFPRDELFHRE